MMSLGVKRHINNPISIAPLAMFRVLFGFMMLVSIIRFIANGWVYDLYIAPKFFFTYYGFEWIEPLGPTGMYATFVIMALSALMVMIGWRYRLAAILFFLSFTYVELIDKTNYLNHYYFVSLVSLIMVLLPANRSFSVDAYVNPKIRASHVPAWCINAVKILLGMVYFYAGIAKLNYDWLVLAQPLSIWLPVHTDLPIIGSLMDELWVAYFFSWFGAIYDLSIPFLLLNKKTRGWAYILVIAFHLMTWWLFPIGMFPFIMILSTLIFFPASFHKKIISHIKRLVRYNSAKVSVIYQPSFNKLKVGILSTFIIFQLLFPWRYLLYPGELFWTEEGFRFSWRVMLIEKAGYVTFHIKDPETGREGEVYPSDYLTANQEKQMSTQPDMILQFAHFVEEEMKQKGIKNPEVRAEAYVTLNGKESRLFLDPEVNLASKTDTFTPKSWILPFEKSVQ